MATNTDRSRTRLFWFVLLWAASVLAALALVFVLRNLFAAMMGG